jgi:hypothetical protein
MSKHLATHPDFIEAFVSECFSNGFNEKQASELLTAYSKAEFYRTDKDFKEGVDSLFKEASTVPKATWNLIKALATSAKGRPGISTPILTGAAAGALTPEGILPDDFQGGALSGAALGGILGALGTRGRGLGASLNRLGKSISSGGVGRTTLGEAGRLLTNKSILKGTGRGILGGLAAAGTTQAMDKGLGALMPGRKPSIDPNTGMPWYMRDGAVASQAANETVADPFELPPEIMARMRSESGVGQAGTNMAGPLGDLSNKKNQLLQLENQIASLQSTLPSGANPSSFAQRQTMQSQLDNLKMQRNSLVGNIGALETQINTDKSNMFNSASQAQRLAERGLASTRNEFDMLRRRQQLAQEGGLLGGLMGAYNRMTGVDRQIAELDPAYAGYENELEQARRLQELAR